MPEEIEVPTEQLHETMHEHAHGHGDGHGGASPPSWIMQVALSSALIAVVAAVGALLAGHHANEAMLEQMKATDQWAYYQAKGIKRAVLESRLELLEAMEKHGSEKDKEKLKKYEEEQKDIEEKAKELDHSSEEHMHRHTVLARSVTTEQIAIATSAISVLTKRKMLWFVSMVVGAIGVAFLAQALL